MQWSIVQISVRYHLDQTKIYVLTKENEKGRSQNSLVIAMEPYSFSQNLTEDLDDNIHYDNHESNTLLGNELC